MRISDWSSDVCSSDLQQRRAARAAVERIEDRREIASDLLPLLHRGARLGEFGFLARLRGEHLQFGDAMLEPFAVAFRLAPRRLRRRKLCLGGPPRNRKSGGSGKRVYGRVILAGGRISTKKKKTI